MKQIFRGFASLILALMIFFQSVNACSISFPPLRKEFRNSKAVFAGKVVKIAEYEPSEMEKSSMPENWRDWNVFSKVTFEINKKWKGNISQKREFIAVAWFVCGCPDGKGDKFKKGEDYLVIATEKNFITICDSSETDSDRTKNKIKKLDSFWFRTWARIYPF